jgi:hypothetical protein
MDAPPTLPFPSNKKIFLYIQITRRFKHGLGFSSFPLQGKVLSKGAKVMKYLLEVKPAKKT